MFLFMFLFIAQRYLIAAQITAEYNKRRKSTTTLICIKYLFLRKTYKFLQYFSQKHIVS